METQQSKPIFSDLDALKVETVHFRFDGRDWALRPLSVMNFFEFSHSVANINLLLRKETKTVSVEQVDKAYFDLFHSVIKEFTMNDVLKMNWGQRVALTQIIEDHIKGKIQGVAEGSNLKKTQPRNSKSFLSRLRGLLPKSA